MIKIGTSGYQFPDWVGIVYPRHMSKDKYLEYYESLGFPTLEINYTYYAMPTVKSMKKFNDGTSAEFDFIVKAHGGMTHDIRTPDRKSFIDNRDAFSEFREAIEPLVSSGKLGGVLFQFPTSFHPTRGNAEYILQCRERLRDVPMIIEYRHDGWVLDKTFKWMERQNLEYCVVDEPKLPRLVPFIARQTGDIAYVRLHGRNKDWFDIDSERYNYDYSEAELEEFVEPVRGLNETAENVYVFFNNCHSGQAAKNARQMLARLGLTDDPNLPPADTPTFWD
jgi:uncharacterized protein YecE (DUF72 family)